MIPGEILTGFADFRGIVSVNDFRLLSCEVLVLHGYAWIHWVAKSSTTTAYRWLLRDSQLSLRTLWSAVIKSPQFSARGTAPPMRLLHGTPCNFGSFDESRNFGLEGNECKHCAYPNPHVSWMWALKMLREKNWRVSLLVQEFHHPPNFLWILAAIPGLHKTTGYSNLSVALFYWFLGFYWLGWQRVAPIYGQHQNLTRALERCHFQFDPLFLESHCHLMLL